MNWALIEGDIIMEKIQDGGTNFNAFAIFHVPQETFTGKNVFSQKFCTPPNNFAFICKSFALFCTKFPQDTLLLLAKMLSNKSFALLKICAFACKNLCSLSKVVNSPRNVLVTYVILIPWHVIWMWPTERELCIYSQKIVLLQNICIPRETLH